jgi:hypothetical protein
MSALGTGGGNVWIGGNDAVTEGTWVWETGEPWAYSNWNAGEPNNSGNEDYIMMYSSGLWNDVYPTYTVMQGYVVEWSSDPNPPPPPTPPAAPTNLQAVLSYSGAILLSWTDNATTESQFEIERRAGAGAFAPIGSVNANITVYDDLDLAPSAAYTYRVRAVNSVGPSGWSNEASAVSGAYVPAPKAPSDLVAVAIGAHGADLSWTDNSDGESGFQVYRGTGTAEPAYLASVGADVTSFHDAGLQPDLGYSWAVRSVGTLRPSGFVQASTSTPPTLEVLTLKGDLKDGTKFGKDLVKATASWTFAPASADGAADPVAEGITVRLGPDAAPVSVKVPGGDPSWKGKGAKWKWKSPRGVLPASQVSLDLSKNLVTVQVKSVELLPNPGNPMRVGIIVGDDGGREVREWAPSKKAGVYKHR